MTDLGKFKEVFDSTRVFRENLESHARSLQPPNLPMPVIPESPDRKCFADRFYEKLSLQINNFDRELDDEHEVGLRLVSFGESITIHVEDIGYQNPSLIVFFGKLEDGNPVTLVQHVSQISLLLTSVKRLDPSKPKQPIGFVPPAEENQEAEQEETPTE